MHQMCHMNQEKHFLPGLEKKIKKVLTFSKTQIIFTPLHFG